MAFMCSDHLGRFFFCKEDRNGKPARATDLVLTRLADEVGIRTAPWSVIEHDGETYFGSQQEVSSATPFRAQSFLTTPRFNELGQPYPFPGEYLAQVLAFDLFFDNPDRGPQNFLLVSDGTMSRLCAIDFADGELANLATDRFPVAQSKTVNIGRRYRQIHGSHLESAIAMVDKIEGLPAAVFSRIVAEIPPRWLTEEAKGDLNASWGSPGFHNRLALLRDGLTDGTLV